MPEQKGKYTRLWGVLLLVGFSSIAWITRPVSLKFGQNILKDLPTMFGYLVLISLFVERAIEVFLSAWRSAGADELDGELAYMRKKITDNVKTTDNQHADDSADKTEIERLKGELELLEIERTRYRADSRFISHWFGLGIGVLVAGVGVRVLSNILDISTLTGNQEGIFIIVDILLTGAVLAGGSEAINKIIKVYNSFMIASADKPKF
ncbi:hypothetical protein ACFL47_00265 [Candidatus Latescibacterota bacterium]